MSAFCSAFRSRSSSLWACSSRPALPRPGLTFWPWVLVGAFAQVAATALMLAAMGERSFVVTIAYIKTEPIQVAIFGLIFLGDVVTWPMMVAIVIATAGVVIMSTNPLAFLPGKRGSGDRVIRHSEAEDGAASFTLAVGIVMQAMLLSLYLALRQRSVLFAIVRAWKRSLFAGFAGAVASQFWFLAFALASAANVRTLALIEVLFAQVIARFAFGQRTSAREALGMVLVVAGVALLMLAQ